MSRTIYWWIAAVAVIVVAGAAVFMIQGARTGSGAGAVSVQSASSTLGQTAASSAPPLDLEQIANIKEVRESLKKVADSYYYYKMNWTNPVKLDLGDQTVYVGQLEKVWSNGKTDSNPLPLLLAQGTLYAANGYGGNAYDLKDTDWVWRYKELDFSNIVPLDEIYASMSQGNMRAFRAAAGVDDVAMKLGKDGAPTSITVTTPAGIKTFTAPFQNLGTITLFTDSDYSDFPDYNSYQEKFRKLPGNVTATTTYTADNGYKITYPAVINGLNVGKLREYEETNGFHDSYRAADSQYDPDVARLDCSQNPQQEVGPRVGAPVAIAPESQAKLIDWGMSLEYHQNVFSFTGPGYHCELRTAGIFRPDMFQISF